jgi:hypothetical protein
MVRDRSATGRAQEKEEGCAPVRGEAPDKAWAAGS